jgi:ComF family protein
MVRAKWLGDAARSSRGAVLSNGLRAVVDVLFPRTCPGCEVVSTLDEDLWCADCAEQLTASAGRMYCPTCGVDVGPYTTPDDRCFRCRDHKPPYDQLVRVGVFSGLLRHLLLGYKFRHQYRLDRGLAQLLGDALIGRSGAATFDAVVPIPSRAHGRHGRPHRPVARLASEVGRLLDLPALPLLGKRRSVRPQRGLSATARWENIRGAFHLRPGVRVTGTTLCLIDDISTTGATLHEAANVLRAGGATVVWAAVVAKTDPDRRDGPLDGRTQV